MEIMQEMMDDEKRGAVPLVNCHFLPKLQRLEIVHLDFG